eukprot:TRINITY_DN9687_c0_g1_i1.p2 TRINITY_DN9687_c0_g1~~TRINITY_DN9687_c0_g1_i1.p2  ORF type:complete len:312 (-),score=171.80 TRINITY_DN9687_c0_g1_i1:63-998(-)
MFSSDGATLATGSSDGFIELWQPRSGRLRRDLTYQANDELLMHDGAVLSLAFSDDALLLASGDVSGVIKVWQVSSGACMRRFDNAHDGSVNALRFVGGGQLLSCSQDETVRVHGIASGSTLRVMRGHASFVNALASLDDSALAVSGGADATLRVWDVRSGDCKSVFQLTAEPEESEAAGGASAVTPLAIKLVDAIKSVSPIAGSPNLLLVCNGTSTLFVVDAAADGNVVRRIVPESLEDERFQSACASADGQIAYALTDLGRLYSFDLSNGSVHRRLDAHATEGVGVVHHPRQSIVATFARNDRKMRLWTP